MDLSVKFSQRKFANTNAKPFWKRYPTGRAFFPTWLLYCGVFGVTIIQDEVSEWQRRIHSQRFGGGREKSRLSGTRKRSESGGLRGSFFPAPRGFAVHSRVLSKLASLARNEELARRPTELRELPRKSEPWAKSNHHLMENNPCVILFASIKLVSFSTCVATVKATVITRGTTVY